MNDLSSCRHSCSAYDATEPKGCFKNLFCAKQENCAGRLFDCQFYHADAWVCMSQGNQIKKLFRLGKEFFLLKMDIDVCFRSKQEV